MVLRLSVFSLGLCLAMACNPVDEESQTSNQSGNEALGEVTASTKLVLNVESLAADGTRAPVSGASVYLAEPSDHADHFHHHPDQEVSATTNEFGNAEVALVADKAYVVHVTAEGFETRVRRVQQAEGTQRQLRLTTTPEQRKTVTIPTTGEVTISLGDTPGGSQAPVTMTIEAGDLGTDNGDGEIVEGDIEITFGSWDPAVDDPTALPSDLRTATEPLFSYGMFHIEFFQNGETLNVRPGQTVGWTTQVHESRQAFAERAIARNAMNLYSLDHNTGLWVQDDMETTYSTETGLLSAEASHFSHKNHDEPGPFPANSCLEITVVNRDGQQLRNTSVEVNGFGSANGNGCSEFACLITDDGNVVSSEDRNGNGRLDEGEDANGNGVLDGADDRRSGVARNIGYTINASRKVPGTNQWQTATQEASALCDDNERVLGCGVGSCGSVSITLCSPENDACAEDIDCCTDDLGCLAGRCTPFE